jgi:hypothetical protein
LLDVTGMFPELLRLPLIPRLLGKSASNTTADIE